MKLPILLCLLAGCVKGAFGLDPQVRSIPVRTHSLQTPYLESDMQSRWFDFGGDTIVRTDKYVRLASDRPSQTGWVFSKIPLTPTNWEIEFEFKIHGKGNLHGDGMAMWITKQRGQEGVVFGSTDNFEGLGIFFDTYKNNRPGVVFPYVMAMVGDGKTSYDKSTDGKDQELAGCSARGIRGATGPTKGRLTYFQDKSLKLDLQYKAEGEWTPCFETGAISLPGVAYLGFSAETGELSDNFDIISVETKNLYEVASMDDGSKPKGQKGASTKAQKREARKASQKGRKEREERKRMRSAMAKDQQPRSGWLWFFVKSILVILGLVLVYAAFTMYRTTTRKSSRFD